MRRALLALLLIVPAAQADKWNVAHLHDEDDSTLFLRGIEFPSDQRGIAIGIVNEKGRQRSVALVTANGGKTWDQVKLKDEPLSLACFAEEACWISSPRSVYRSEEGGREWKKVSDTKGILKMHFVSATQGWAAGARKSAWETKDGGKTWVPLAALKDVKATPENAAYMTIAMNGPFGLIGGTSRPPRKDDSMYPDWMVPEEAASRREWPGMMMLLETRDGGKSWTPSANSLFGTLTALRIRPDNRGATALLEYIHTFEVPSEVLFVDFKTGKSTSIYRNKNTAITDILLAPGGSVLVAGTDATALRTLPIPQKIRFLETTINEGASSIIWTQHDVDYRVTGRRVHLARKPNGQFWAVTDSGFILRLDRDVKAAK